MSMAGAAVAALVAWDLFDAFLGGLFVLSLTAWLVLSIAGLGLGLAQLLRPRVRRLRRPAIAAALGAASLLVVALAAAGAAGLLSEGSLESDDDLIATFHRHESEFAQAMAVYEDSGRVDGALLGRLGVDPSTVWRDQDGVVYLTVSTKGLAVSGSTKGYAYSEKPLTPLVDRTDGYLGGDGGGFLVFRHIGGAWYIYYDRTT